ncbi:MAG: acyl carrier protein [Gemmatimonadota bacterium]
MISDKVRSVIARSVEIEEDGITPERTFDELGIDSLDAVEIMFGLEEEFDIEISDEQARSVRTVGEVIELLRAQLAGRADET